MPLTLQPWLRTKDAEMGWEGKRKGRGVKKIKMIEIKEMLRHGGSFKPPRWKSGNEGREEVEEAPERGHDQWKVKSRNEVCHG